MNNTPLILTALTCTVITIISHLDIKSDINAKVKAVKPLAPLTEEQVEINHINSMNKLKLQREAIELDALIWRLRIENEAYNKNIKTTN